MLTDSRATDEVAVDAALQMILAPLQESVDHDGRPAMADLDLWPAVEYAAERRMVKVNFRPSCCSLYLIYVVRARLFVCLSGRLRVGCSVSGRVRPIRRRCYRCLTPMSRWRK